MRQGNNPGIFDEIMGRLDRPHRYKNYILSRCPEHNDKHPSFFVYPDWFFCKSCGFSGKTETLSNRLQGIFYPESDTSPKNPFYEWKLRFGGLREALKFAYQTGKQYPIQMEYLTKRHINFDTISELKLGCLDEYITVPVFKDKKLVGATCRMIDGDARYFNPNAQNHNLLFIPNEDLVNRSNVIYLVFGIFDAVSLCQQGFPVLTTLTGTVIKSDAFDGIRKKIIVIPDKGEEKVASRLTAKLGWRGKLKLIDYPVGTKDINDLLRNGYQEIINGLARS
jgi:hypothetical protein